MQKLKRLHIGELAIKHRKINTVTERLSSRLESIFKSTSDGKAIAAQLKGRP